MVFRLYDPTDPDPDKDPIGSCTATDSGHGAGCCVLIPPEFPPGTTLDWTIEVEGLPMQSGSAVVPGCASAISVGRNYALTELYSSLTLTDPAGNEITLTVDGCDFSGSHYYPGPASCATDAYGNPVGITIHYRYAVCTPCSNVVGFSSSCTLYAEAVADVPGFGFCNGAACFDSLILGHPYTLVSMSRSCPEMLQTWTLDFNGVGFTGGVFNPFYPSPHLTYTLTP